MRPRALLLCWLLALCLPWTSAPAAPPTAAQAAEPPVGRFGTLPTPYTGWLMRTPATGPDDLTEHDYLTHVGEDSSHLAYACRTGFLDVDHLRDAADWTAYLYLRFIDAFHRGASVLVLTGSERGVRLRVRWRLPPGATAAEQTALAVDLARQHAHWILAWHEVMTWFGYRTVLLAPERVSAFSFEDTTSHLVGLATAEAALARPEPWNEAMRLALAQQLRELGALPPDGVYQALRKVRNRWWNSHLSWPSNGFVQRRQLELGLDGLPVVPWLIRDLPVCAGAAPAALPITARTLPAGLVDTVIEDGFGLLASLPRPPKGTLPDRGDLELPGDLLRVMTLVRLQVLAELGADADRSGEVDEATIRDTRPDGASSPTR